MSAEGSTRAVITAPAANPGIAVTKSVAFALTGSSSLPAAIVLETAPRTAVRESNRTRAAVPIARLVLEPDVLRKGR